MKETAKRLGNYISDHAEEVIVGVIVASIFLYSSGYFIRSVKM